MNDPSDHPAPIPAPSRIGRGLRSRVACALLATLALGLAACGGDDESSTSADSTATTESDAPAELTAGEFIVEVEADKQAYIEEVLAADPDCADVKADRDFLLVVTVEATDLAPDEPVNPVIVDSCAP